MSLWLGARVGWFFPFGNVFAKGTPQVAEGGATYYVLDGRPWTDYAHSGPMFELDAGIRIARAYTVFAVWERAQTRSSDQVEDAGSAQDGGDSDFWAIGMRASSDPDRLGFITEIAIGYRRARTMFENGAEYHFTDAPFEARLGLGVEYRHTRLLSFSAIATIGVGAFGNAERVSPNGGLSSLTSNLDEADGHAWATIQLGAAFDLLPSAK